MQRRSGDVPEDEQIRRHIELITRQRRNRAFVAAVGDADIIEPEILARFDMRGREAVNILKIAREGTPVMREHFFGSA